METTRISGAAGRVTSRLLPPLAMSLLACVSGSSGATPAGTTPPSIAGPPGFPPGKYRFMILR
jgi:hypothetical protein